MEMKNKQKEKKEKMGGILYIALAAVVVAGAILTGILMATLDDDVVPDNPVDTTPDDLPTGGEEDPTLVLPEFMAPAVGLVTKSHDTDTLVYFSTTDDWRVHMGIDISTGLGDTVMAAADGVVSKIEDTALFGKTVTISHNGGAVTIYSNLASELAEGLVVGKEVKCGDAIGSVGESASLELTEEPHLHFEMMVGGEQVDPMDFISENSKATDLSQDMAYEG